MLREALVDKTVREVELQDRALARTAARERALAEMAEAYVFSNSELERIFPKIYF